MDWKRKILNDLRVELSDEFDRMARAVLNTFNRYQAAEYNTALSRPVPSVP